jgi:hypothetical protein
LHYYILLLLHIIYCSTNDPTFPLFDDPGRVLTEAISILYRYGEN